MKRSAPDSRSALLRYGCVPITVALAIWVRLLLDPVIGDHYPFATLFFAILVTAAYGGFGPGLLAVGLGAFSAAYFLLQPRGSLRLEGLDEYVGMALLVGTGLGIALLGGTMREARRRAEAGAQEARRQAHLIDQTHEAVLVWDWNGAITFWNHGAELLYGFTAGEALTRVSHDLLHTRTEARRGRHPGA